MTQAKKLIQAIRESEDRGMTYGELEALRVSTCPWRRLLESGESHLLEGESLTKRVGSDGLTRFVIVKSEVATA